MFQDPYGEATKRLDLNKPYHIVVMDYLFANMIAAIVDHYYLDFEAFHAQVTETPVGYEYNTSYFILKKK